jgi:hypothetical protein
MKSSLQFAYSNTNNIVREWAIRSNFAIYTESQEVSESSFLIQKVRTN